MSDCRPVVGAPAYGVSSTGLVRRGARVLVDRGHPRGYRIVDISIAGKATSKAVHKLVCEAFHGPSLGRQVDHKDDVKSHNSADNLEWVSARENTRRAISAGIHPAAIRKLPTGAFVALATSTVAELRQMLVDDPPEPDARLVALGDVLLADVRRRIATAPVAGRAA